MSVLDIVLLGCIGFPALVLISGWLFVRDVWRHEKRTYFRRNQSFE